MGTLLAPRIRQWNRAALTDALRARGVPSGPVHSVGEALTDAQVLDRETVISQDGYRGTGIPYSDDEIAAATAEEGN